MAVYVVEIPNNSPHKHSFEDVEREIKKAFPYTNVTVKRKHNGSLKDLAWEEEYSAIMGAG